MSENEQNKNASIQRDSKNEEKPEKSRMILSVTRIDCVTCSLAIEKQIKKLKGIEDIKTSVMLNKIYIDYDSHIIDSEQIRRAVDKTGYKRYMTIEEKR